MKKFALIVILVLLAAMFLGADIYTKSVERVEAFELLGKKQPEILQMKERWYGQGKYAEIGKDTTTIIDLEKGKMIFALHAPKAYFELPIDSSGKKFLDFIASLSPKVAEAIESVKITGAKVNLGTERKKIANWDCTATEFEMVIVIPALNLMPKFRMKLWATEDLPADYEKAEKMGEIFFRNFFGALNIEESSKKELDKLESVGGFQIAVEITMEIFGTQIRMESQSLEVTEKPAPPGIYSVPKGYKKRDLNIKGIRAPIVPEGNVPPQKRGGFLRGA